VEDRRQESGDSSQDAAVEDALDTGEARSQKAEDRSQKEEEEEGSQEPGAGSEEVEAQDAPAVEQGIEEIGDRRQEVEVSDAPAAEQESEESDVAEAPVGEARIEEESPVEPAEEPPAPDSCLLSPDSSSEAQETPAAEPAEEPPTPDSYLLSPVSSSEDQDAPTAEPAEEPPAPDSYLLSPDSSPDPPVVTELPAAAFRLIEGDPELRAVVEAIVYVTEEPVTAAQIAVVVKRSEQDVKDVLASLAAACTAPERGIMVREIAGGYKMATKAEHHETLRAFARSLKPPLKLSLAALETLATIAYKQPITAPEIMEIRGVQGAGVLKTLLDRKLIQTAGRKNVVGRPILYRTTKEFLVQFGLKDLSELPTLKEFEELSRLAVSEPDTPPAPPVSEEPDASGTPPEDPVERGSDEPAES
jgi:segregation and condensation protein B